MSSLAVIVLCVLAEQVGREVVSGFAAVSHNPGAAFGLMGGSPGVALALSGVACAVILGVIFFGNVRPLTRFGLSVMAGGALSNLLERIFLGHVVDWIPVMFMDLRYNLADVEISLGALITFIAVSRINKDSPDEPSGEQ